MRRLPIRWRVTLAFAGALAVVLAALGVFLAMRLRTELAATQDRGLRARAAEVAALVRRAPTGLPQGRPGLETEESPAQVLRADGTVAAGSPSGLPPLVGPATLHRALAGPVFADRPGDAALDEALRLLAVPVRAGGRRFVVVVGASRDETAEAVSSFAALEAAGLAVALLLASAAGWWVAGLALRPVDAMRAEAGRITDRPDRRLSVPRGDDELARLARTLNAMLDRLDRARAAERDALARERRFVADASHELRTPLTILRGEVDVALLGDEDIEGLRRALRSAGEEAERLSRLADDLLLLARADEGVLVRGPEPVGVRDLLEAAAARARPAGGGRPLTVDAPAGLVAVGDPGPLAQALDNLVGNALVHGGGEVVLSARGGPGVVHVAVRDHGPGFPPGFAGRAFERFSRGGAARTTPGAGLGLAIVDAVARAHGGSVAARDAGPGALVEMTLPAPSPSAHAPPATLVVPYPDDEGGGT